MERAELKRLMGVGVAPGSATSQPHTLGQIIENDLGLDFSSVKWGLTNTRRELRGHDETTCA